MSGPVSLAGYCLANFILSSIMRAKLVEAADDFHKNKTRSLLPILWVLIFENLS